MFLLQYILWCVAIPLLFFPDIDLLYVLLMHAHAIATTLLREYNSTMHRFEKENIKNLDILEG